MIINLRNFDCSVNSPCQYQRKCMDKSRANIDTNAGREINFFSDSHLAPKFFKVVANSKKVGRHFQRKTKSFFTLSAF